MGNIKHLKRIAVENGASPDRINSAGDFIGWSIETNKDIMFVAVTLVSTGFYTMPTVAVIELCKEK